MKEINPEFCTGVQILLKRMESNPEEFNVSSGNYGKWGRVLEQVVIAKEAGSEKLPYPNHLNGITAAEINALYAGFSQFLRKRFDDYIMKEILSDAEELSYSVTSAQPTVLGNSHGGSYTLGAGGGNSSYAFGYTDHAQHLALHKQYKQALEEMIKEVKETI